MIPDFEQWKNELLFTGNIVQDGDTSVDPDEAGRRCRRYVELLDMVEGNEGQAVFEAVIDSIQAKEDYGVYESTGNIPLKFPGDVYAAGLIATLPGLIQRNADWAEQFLVGIARTAYMDDSPYIRHFNNLMAQVEPSVRQIILDFIHEREEQAEDEDDNWWAKYLYPNNI